MIADQPILDLFRQSQRGDRDALDQLVTKLQPLLHEEISRVMGSGLRLSADSMDIAQTVVLNFLRHGPRFVPESESHLRALLRRIAHNYVIDSRRRSARRDEGPRIEALQSSGEWTVGVEPSAPSKERPSQIVERESESSWLRLALQFLEPDDRYLLVAREIEGRDWAQIAGELGLHSADAARVRCVRLKPRIARLFIELRKGKLPEADWA